MVYVLSNSDRFISQINGGGGHVTGGGSMCMVCNTVTSRHMCFESDIFLFIGPTYLFWLDLDVQYCVDLASGKLTTDASHFLSGCFDFILNSTLRRFAWPCRT